METTATTQVKMSGSGQANWDKIRSEMKSKTQRNFIKLKSDEWESWEFDMTREPKHKEKDSPWGQQHRVFVYLTNGDIFDMTKSQFHNFVKCLGPVQTEKMVIEGRKGIGDDGKQTSKWRVKV